MCEHIVHSRKNVRGCRCEVVCEILFGSPLHDSSAELERTIPYLHLSPVEVSREVLLLDPTPTSTTPPRSTRVVQIKYSPLIVHQNLLGSRLQFFVKEFLSLDSVKRESFTGDLEHCKYKKQEGTWLSRILKQSPRTASMASVYEFHEGLLWLI